MNTYIVIRRDTDAEVYRYSADVPIEWTGFEFATHDHIQMAEPVDPEPIVPADRPEDWYIYVGPFYDRFGAYKLPILASTDPLLQAVIKDSSVRKYIDLKGRHDELLQVIGLLQSKGFAVTADALLDLKPTDAEVYRG